jgi:hypothetical protein
MTFGNIYDSEDDSIVLGGRPSRENRESGENYPPEISQYNAPPDNTTSVSLTGDIYLQNQVEDPTMESKKSKESTHLKTQAQAQAQTQTSIASSAVSVTQATSDGTRAQVDLEGNSQSESYPAAPAATPPASKHTQSSSSSKWRLPMSLSARKLSPWKLLQVGYAFDSKCGFNHAFYCFFLFFSFSIHAAATTTTTITA